MLKIILPALLNRSYYSLLGNRAGKIGPSGVRRHGLQSEIVGEIAMSPPGHIGGRRQSALASVSVVRDQFNIQSNRESVALYRTFLNIIPEKWLNVNSF